MAPQGTTPRDPTFLSGLLSDVRYTPLWLALRVALGWFWLETGWSHLSRPAGLGDPLAVGLTLAGIALILGVLTGPSAFIGGCFSATFVTGGALPLETLHFAAIILLVLAWKTAGWIGLDRWLLPLLGLPWRSGALFDDWQDQESVLSQGRKRE